MSASGHGPRLLSHLRNALDLHILMNTAHSPSIVNSSASASWLPLCLPKFNPAGFVNTFITYLQQEEQAGASYDTDQQSAPAASDEISDVPKADGLPEADVQESTSNFVRKSTMKSVGSEVGLICVSGNGDFESIRAWCDAVTKVLTVIFPHNPSTHICERTYSASRTTEH